MCGSNDSGNSMPESDDPSQTVECLADIRKRGGTSSGIMVFDSEQRGTTTAHAAHYDSFTLPESNFSQVAKYSFPKDSRVVSHIYFAMVNLSAK